MSRAFTYRQTSYNFNSLWFQQTGDRESNLDETRFESFDIAYTIDLEGPQHIGREKIILPPKEPEVLDEKTLLQRLVQEIYQGQHLLKALKATQRKIGANSIEGIQGSQFLAHNGYAREANGVLEYINKALIKRQRRLVGYILRQLGECLVEGRSLLTISLPLHIFEKRSILERSAATFGYAPYFLEKGGEIDDPLEQFKMVVTFWLTTMQVGINQEKPFDAVIGETFQGYIGDCAIYMEQTSHEPQITSFQMHGKKFTMDGFTRFAVDTSPNSVKARQFGQPKITFKNNKTAVYAQLPSVQIGGTAVGKRTFSYVGKAYAYDIENGYYCEIAFDPGSDWFSKRKLPKDYIQGSIWKATPKLIAKLRAMPSKSKEFNASIKPREDFSNEVSKIEGSWLDYIEFDGINYWRCENYKIYPLVSVENPLPSDCKYRLDIIQLKLGEEAIAQDLKAKLEESQRRDAKLRVEYAKKHPTKKKSKK